MELTRVTAIENDDYNFVGKYDSLVVWEREDGMRWSVFLNEWVTEESGEFTSWLDEDDRPELDESIAAGLVLPEGGKWVDINEC